MGYNKTTLLRWVQAIATASGRDESRHGITIYDENENGQRLLEYQ